MSYSRIEATPLSGALGAEISGVDLARLDDATFSEIHQAFVDFGVICFRDQKLTPQAQAAFARRFGDLDVHPIVRGTEDIPEVVRVWKPAGESASFGVGWHSDNSFFAKPSLGSVLFAATVPPYGGDTLYASMEKAYDALSTPMKQFLGGLAAVHSASRAYDPKTTGDEKYRGEAPINYRFDEKAIYSEVTHPVIRTHPESGRKSVYVNPMFTQKIVGLGEDESRALLRFLYDFSVRPEFTCRLRWQAGTLTMWDNRSVQHYAVDDYREFDRLMFRVTICGDVPV